MPTSTYCSGRKKKNTIASAQWSPRRVYESDTNSRSAMNEMNPNSTTTPVLPNANASPSTTTITHHAFTRAMRLSIVGCGSPCATLCRSTTPMTLARTSTAKMPAKSVSRFGCAPVIASGRASCRWRRKREQRVTEPLEERVLVFTRPDPQRRAESQRAQQRDRQELALGHHAVQVLDPDGDALDVGPRRHDAPDAAAKRQQRRVGRVA